MEGVPKQETNNVESLGSYREERAAGYQAGETMVNDIADYEKMDFREQISVLKDLLVTLEEDNANRFAANYVSARIQDLEISADQAALEEKRPDLVQYTDMAA